MSKDMIEVPRELLEVINHMASGFAFNQREKDIIAEVDTLLNPPPDPDPSFTAEEVEKWRRDLMVESCWGVLSFEGFSICSDRYRIWRPRTGWTEHATTEDKVKLNKFFERKRNER